MRDIICMEGTSLPAALIICFHPDHEKLGHLITAISSSVKAIVIFDNGGLEADRLPVIQTAVRIESRGSNLGIATALNVACDVALELGCRYAISFDQDSLPTAGMIETLRSELTQALDAGLPVGAIGPQVLDVRGGVVNRSAFARTTGLRFRRWWGGGTEPVSIVITSACLFDLQAWQRVRFMDELFIDLVDLNWCWRLADHGYVVLGTTKTVLQHELSEGRRKVGRSNLAKYGTVRRFFQSRNAIYHLLYVPLSWGGKYLSLRMLAWTLVSAAVMDEMRWRSLWQCLRGAVYGIRKKLGPYPS